jgi:phenylpropionate dioxygenase-like ring-hydroxylating dioxygenase large terminal subunit
MTPMPARPPSTPDEATGKWTTAHPDLGTGPVSFEDCVSEQFFLAEREKVFKRSWLKVGRVEQLPRVGSFFTRDLTGLGSIVICRAENGVNAFHNVCSHRGNKVVWTEHPKQESSGTCREFACKYHGWRYGLDGQCTHVTNEGEFFGLDKRSLGLPPVACDVWAGFIFVNFADAPEPLREFLGERYLEVESYPFDKMTQRYGFSTRIHGNWKLSIDALLEWYHPAYVHGRFIHTDVKKAEKMVPPVGAYYYDIFRPHMLTSTPGPPVLAPREPGTLGPPGRDQNWVYKLFRAGLFGPDDVPDLGPLPDALNQGRIRSWGNDSFWLYPNFSVQIWSRGYYITYQYWPEAVDSHTYLVDLYFPEPRNARERLAQEVTVASTMEFAMQDSNTIEATHSALATRARTQFTIGDQELLIRSFHKFICDEVGLPARQRAGTGPR